MNTEIYYNTISNSYVIVRVDSKGVSHIFSELVEHIAMDLFYALARIETYYGVDN